MNLCACGCGREAKKKWYDYLCRMRYKNAQRTPEKRRQEGELARARKELAKYPSVVVEATVHKMNHDDEIQVQRAVVRVPVPAVGLWGVQWGIQI